MNANTATQFDEHEDYDKFNNDPLNFQLLQEECAEVIQCASKIVRFGIDDRHPRLNQSNREHLTQELGDLLAIMLILKHRGAISEEGVIEATERKFKKLPKNYQFIEEPPHDS